MSFDVTAEAGQVRIDIAGFTVRLSPRRADKLSFALQTAASDARSYYRNNERSQS